MAQTKEYFAKKVTKIRGTRVSLALLLIPEVFILLMHFPGFLGAEWLETALVAVRTFLVNILWPSDAADMLTYKGTIYEICVWFQRLPVYKLLVRIVIFLVPGLIVFTVILEKIYKFRIARLDNPKPAAESLARRRIRARETKPQKPARPEKVKDSKIQGLLWRSGLTPEQAKEANTYCKQIREQCDDPFAADPGIRIQRMSPELGLDARRDEVLTWDHNHVITLTPIIRRPVRVVLDQGTAYIEAGNRRCPEPLKRFVPRFINEKNEDGCMTLYVITWLGG